MSGRDLFCQPRRFGRGAALTLVFASVLVAGAATGSLPGPDRKSPEGASRSAASAGRHEEVAEAAAKAMADGKSPMEAAERAVSRSGDRWGAVYSQGSTRSSRRPSTAPTPASGSGPAASATAVSR